MHTNLKIGLFVIASVSFFVIFASSIPQVESRPPEETNLGSDLTPEQLAEAGREIVTGDKGGCLNCHGLGEAGPRAPDLEGVGARAASREAGVAAEDYLRQALMQPCDFVVEGYDCLMGGLALDRNLTPGEITAVVAFLQSLGGEITVSLSPEDLAAAPVAPAAGGPGLAGSTPEELAAEAGCGACHTLSALGLAGQVGPDLSSVGARLAPEEIRQSILDPGAVLADDCPTGPCPPGVMPQNFGERFSAAQLETLVGFLAAQGGEASAASATEAPALAGSAGQPTAAAPTQPPATALVTPQTVATAIPATVVAAAPTLAQAVRAPVQPAVATPPPEPNLLLFAGATVGLIVLTFALGAGLAYAVLMFSRLCTGLPK